MLDTPPINGARGVGARGVTVLAEVLAVFRLASFAYPENAKSDFLFERSDESVELSKSDTASGPDTAS